MGFRSIRAHHFPPKWEVGPEGKDVHIYPLFKSFERILFLGEHIDRSVIDIESQDANFLEQEFPRKVEVSRDSDFYELDKSEPSCPVKQEEHHPCE